MRFILRLLFYILLAILLLAAYIFYADRHPGKSLLLESLLSLDHNDVKLVIYIPGVGATSKPVCTEFDKVDDIIEIIGWLNRAEDTDYVRQGAAIREGRLILIDESDKGEVYQVSIYSQEPGDTYLSMSQWVKNPDGSYKRQRAHPVIVPGFSLWLFPKIENNGESPCPKFK